MIYEIIGMIVVATIIAITVVELQEYLKKRKMVNISFKEALDLIELPVVTFVNNGKKLNFLLDTGSNLSHINSKLIEDLDCTPINKNMDIVGFEGTSHTVDFIEMIVSYKNKDFKEEFTVCDLEQSFAIIKEESGIQLHGILGSLFFQKYKYVLDFNTLIAQSKK